ncbi:uncharacterized protein CANTADRAFT_28040, partial [Suhomyces tanzawaensis NRRL Y-17324]
SILAALSSVQAAYVPSEPYTTLTPSAKIPASASALTDFDGSFALSIKTLLTNSAATTAKLTASVVNQIGDGQVQQQTSAKQTASVVNQIGDGQVQQQTAAKQTASVVNQIGDGQIQQQTAAKQTASVVNQIGDGQIQQQTAAKQTASVVNQIGDGQVQQQTTAKLTASVVNQITDGQVQQQTAAKPTTPTTLSVVNQITDGQVQQQTTSKTTASVANQITDGQVQQQTTSKQTASAISQISDGQVQNGQSQATAAAQTAAGGDSDSTVLETCVDADALTVTLKNGVLHDSKGRVGAIVANRQFQFDGPPPQAGSIYAAGWSLVPSSYKEDSTTKQQADDASKPKRADSEGLKLALGKQTTFYKCLSGDFYNLYDESIGSQCSEIEIEILKAVQC